MQAAINNYKILTNNYIRSRTHKCKHIEYELQVPRSGTYNQKPTASCEAAPLWASNSPFLFCSAKRDKHINLKESAICL